MAATTLEAAPDAVITFDENGDVVTLNRTAEALFAVSVAEAAGRPVSDLGLPLAARPSPLLGRRLEVAALRRDVSAATVKTHFEHIYTKLGVSDRAAAVAEGLRPGGPSWWPGRRR